jgi:hypothetical protein
MCEKLIGQSNERTNDHCNEDKIEPSPCVNPTLYTTLLNTGNITGHFQTPPINCIETSTPIVEHSCRVTPYRRRCIPIVIPLEKRFIFHPRLTQA